MNALSTTLSAQIIKDIWLSMSAIYGNRWISGYGAQPNTLAVQWWSEGLKGINENQIKTAIQACLKLDDEWPPSLPQFRKLCLAIPAFSCIKEEMRQADYSAFTRFVMGFLDHWQYRNADQYHAEKLLKQAYDLAVHHRLNGAPLPELPTALLENKPEPVKPITAEEKQAKAQMSALARENAMNEIRALFGWT